MRRIIRFSVFAALFLLFTPGSRHLYARQQQPGVAVDPDGDADPDLPVIQGVTVDKDQYLQAREAHIGLLRGLPYPPGENPRIRAIRTAERTMKSSGAAPNALVPAWTFVGPVNLPNGQTELSRLPVSGRVTAIAIHPTHPETVYAGTAQGGVYRTFNGGASWTPIFDNALSLSIGALTIDPLNTSILFVGTGEGNTSLDSYFGVGLYIVRNAETSPVLSGPFATDSLSNNVLAYRSINKIIVDPANDNIVFVGTTSGYSGASGDAYTNRPPRGLYRSTNALAAQPFFSVINLGSGTNPIINDIITDPSNPNIMVVSVYGQSSIGITGGFYRTTDALDPVPAFTSVLSQTDFQNVKFCANKVGSVVTMYAATAESIGTLRVSHDDGVTWSAPIAAANGFCYSQCWYDIAIAMSPTDSSRVYLGGSAASYGKGSNEFKYTTNGGASFTNSSTNLHADVHAIAVASAPNSNIIYLGCDGGMFRSSNSGATWSSINTSGFTALQFESIALHHSSRNFTIGGTQDNGTPWMKASGTWTQADWGDGGFAAIDQSSTDTLNVTMYHTYYNQTNNLVGYAKVVSATNAADGSWGFIGNGSNGISLTDNVLFYAPLVLGPGTPNTVYYGTDRLYRSANQGVSNTVVSQAPITGSPITAIGIARENDNVRIVGLQDGTLWATTTGSDTLTNVTGATPGYYPARIAIDPVDQNTAYVTYDGYGSAVTPLQHIWKTTTLSTTATWTASSNGLPDVPVNGLVIDPRKASDLYCGTDIGVFYSSDAGANWSVYGTGLPRSAVFDVAIQDSFRLLRVATHGKGMWEIPTAYQGAAMVTVNGVLLSNWNLLSLPVNPANDSLTALYPGALGSAFLYSSGYVPTTTLSAGKGFWLRVGSAQPFSLTGQAVTGDTIPVSAGWNMIGAVGVPVTTSTILSQPPGMTTSAFFGYNGAYVANDTLQPGYGYWVNASQAGSLILNGGPRADFSTARIHIRPTAELPPSPPHTDQSAGNVPTAFRLEQNYPNPFNPSTTIKFELPADSYVRVSVVNILGEVVDRLVDGVRKAGYYSVVWNASSRPSGIYFYRLDAGSTSPAGNGIHQIRKMLLLK
ncbi:MAG TPA: T9SS type A sorting domain-containing protein [Bacteroidota bacterium]|nr:T9SS type A sorting domain-containing protein [Bacteroidota bacterium]